MGFWPVRLFPWLVQVGGFFAQPFTRRNIWKEPREIRFPPFFGGFFEVGQVWSCKTWLDFGQNGGVNVADRTAKNQTSRIYFLREDENWLLFALHNQRQKVWFCWNFLTNFPKPVANWAETRAPWFFPVYRGLYNPHAYIYIIHIYIWILII